MKLLELKQIIREEIGNLLSEGVKFHLNNKIPVNENIFRPGSTKYFELFAEVRKLSKEEQDDPQYEGHEHTLDLDNAKEYGQHEFLQACKDMGIVKDLWKTPIGMR